MSKFIATTAHHFTEDTMSSFIEQFPQVYDAIDASLSLELRLQNSPNIGVLLLKSHLLTIEHITALITKFRDNAPHPSIPIQEISDSLKWLQVSPSLKPEC